MCVSRRINASRVELVLWWSMEGTWSLASIWPVTRVCATFSTALHVSPTQAFPEPKLILVLQWQIVCYGYVIILFLNRAWKWPVDLWCNYASEILSIIIFRVSDFEYFGRAENSKEKCECYVHSVLEFPSFFVAHYHIHSRCVHTGTSCFLHQFVSLTAQWTPFLNLFLPALAKYAVSPGQICCQPMQSSLSFKTLISFPVPIGLA